MIRTAALTSALMLVGCSERGISSLPPIDEGLEPAIQLDPPVVDFGLMQPGDRAQRTVTVTNVGEDVLNFDGWLMEGSPDFELIGIDDLPERLEVDMAATFDVVFSPSTAGNIGATVWINSDDPLNAQAELILAGEGSGPALRISPDPYDFYSVFVGCGDDTELTLANVGDGDLVIDDVAIQSDAGQFSLQSNLSLPLTLGPGQDTSVIVGFSALAAGSAEGTLTVTSNDPRGEVMATQLAEGAYAGQRIDTFVMPEDPAVDILFAIDQSCSMDSRSANLGSNFNTFIDSLDEVTSNWQVGVVTQSTACINDTRFTGTTTNLISRFTSAVGLGTEEAATERLFTLTQAALGKTAPGQCNAGMIRDDALLHVVLVSDEFEQSGVSPGTFVTDVWSYKDSPTDVRISGIICPNNRCDSGDGHNGGYAQAVNLGGGEQLNILTNNWGASAVTLAETSVDGVGRFELSGTPDPNSMTVRVNGDVANTGWYLDQSTNEVVFDMRPSPGADIEVTYGLNVACP